MCTTIHTLGTTTLAWFVSFRAASQYLLFIAFIDDTPDQKSTTTVTTKTMEKKKKKQIEILFFSLFFTDFCFDTLRFDMNVFIITHFSHSRCYFGFQVASQHFNSKMKRRAKIKANEKMAYKIYFCYISCAVNLPIIVAVNLRSRCPIGKNAQFGRGADGVPTFIFKWYSRLINYIWINLLNWNNWKYY